MLLDGFEDEIGAADLGDRRRYEERDRAAGTPADARRRTSLAPAG
jgi:hypothetical protein